MLVIETIITRKSIWPYLGQNHKQIGIYNSQISQYLKLTKLEATHWLLQNNIPPNITAIYC